MREKRFNEKTEQDIEIIKKKKKRAKAMLKRVRGKNSFAFAFVGLAMIGLTFRIFYINHHDGDRYSKIVLDSQHYISTVLPYKRGQITDRNGTILAYSEQVYNLILDPKIMLSDEKYKEPTMEALVKCLKIKAEDIENILKSKPESHYERMLKNLTSDQVAELKAILKDTKNNPNIKGVWLEDSYIRKYPFSTLACDLIGFANATNGGELGIESYYNESLTGVDGITYGYVDDELNIAQTTKDPIDGYNIISTIDYSVQSIIEKHIKAFNDSYGSANTAVVVMNPDNGDVLGMASYPVFDLNSPRDLTKVYTADALKGMTEDQKNSTLYSLWKNYCVSSIYEPGSTFKPFTVSAALEENKVNTTETFLCTGHELIGGWTIPCHVKTGHGKLTIKEAIMQSCNPAMMQIAARMGVATFTEYQARFGFGAKTGIDLPGEEKGITIAPENMSVTDLATNSFGQNFNVTMVQLLSGFCSLINGGNYYQPHVVRRIEKADGEVVEKYDASLVRQTITESTSAIIRDALKATVDSGLAQRAKVQGYSIAGKTGTAQKQPRDKYVISFVGYAPAEDPKFAIYVLIDEPGEKAGQSGTSGPVLTLTNQILTDLLPYMNVYKDTDAPRVDTSNAPVEAYDTPVLHN